MDDPDHIPGQLQLEDPDTGWCSMPGCPRETESWTDLCDPCQVTVAELVERIGEPARVTASAWDLCPEGCQSPAEHRAHRAGQC